MALRDAAWNLRSYRRRAQNRASLLPATLALLLLLGLLGLVLLLGLLGLVLLLLLRCTCSVDRGRAAWRGLGRTWRSLRMRNRRKDLVLRASTGLPTVWHLPSGLTLQRPAEAGSGHGARGTTEVSRGWWCGTIVVGKQAAGTVDGAGYPRCHGLVDGYRAGGALMGGGRVAVAGFSVSLAVALPLPLSLLVATHLLVLLNDPVALLHVAVAVKGRPAVAAVEVLAVHVDLDGTNRDVSGRGSSSRRTENAA